MTWFDAVCGVAFAIHWWFQLKKDKEAIVEEKKVSLVRHWYLTNKDAEERNNARDAAELKQWMIDDGYVKFSWRNDKYIIQTPFGELGGEMRYYI